MGYADSLCRLRVLMQEKHAKKRNHYGIPTKLKYEFFSANNRVYELLLSEKKKRILQRISVAWVYPELCAFIAGPYSVGSHPL